MIQDPYEIEERPLGTVLSELFAEFRRFWAQTAELASRETGEITTKLAGNIVNVIAGGVIAYSGFLVLLLAAVAGAALYMPVWAAALCVGGVVFLVGAVLLLAGVNTLKSMDYTPKQTLAALQEDKEWASRQI